MQFFWKTWQNHMLAPLPQENPGCATVEGPLKPPKTRFFSIVCPFLETFAMRSSDLSAINLDLSLALLINNERIEMQWCFNFLAVCALLRPLGNPISPAEMCQEFASFSESCGGKKFHFGK